MVSKQKHSLLQSLNRYRRDLECLMHGSSELTSREAREVLIPFTQAISRQEGLLDPIVLIDSWEWLALLNNGLLSYTSPGDRSLYGSVLGQSFAESVVYAHALQDLSPNEHSSYLLTLVSDSPLEDLFKKEISTSSGFLVAKRFKDVYDVSSNLQNRHFVSKHVAPEYVVDTREVFCVTQQIGADLSDALRKNKHIVSDVFHDISSSQFSKYEPLEYYMGLLSRR